MEKLIIIGLGFMLSTISFGYHTPTKPQIYRCKAEKSIKKTDKPVFIPYTYIIKDYDPH